MKTIDVLNNLTEYALKYREISQESLIKNNHMNHIKNDEYIQKRYIDAVLVDFINYIGFKSGIDYGIYTKDLKLKKNNSKFEWKRNSIFK